MLRVGVLTCAHMHVWSYVQSLKVHPETSVAGIWDDDEERGQKFAQGLDIPFVANIDELLSNCDAVAIGSENRRHAELIEIAAAADKHIICEKPLVTSLAEAERVERAIAGSDRVHMVAFPCRYSPAYQRLKARVKAGDIGDVVAVSATNHGRCPFGWFTEPEKSGGGALVDHVVHVGDLLRDLFGQDPIRVQAHIGNNMYGQVWDDIAMITLEYANGVFATIDSSWSRPATFKVWGDVTMTVVGTEGVIEMDMFGQDVQHYHPGDTTHTVIGYGSNSDALLFEDFVECCLGRRKVTVGFDSGLATSRLFISGYESVRLSEPTAV